MIFRSKVSDPGWEYCGRRGSAEEDKADVAKSFVGLRHSFRRELPSRLFTTRFTAIKICLDTIPLISYQGMKSVYYSII